MSPLPSSQSGPIDPKLVAAIVAAVQAFMDAEIIVKPPAPGINAWRQAARAWQAGDQYGRQTSWRGID